jgi:cell division septal protein FtsQ
MEQIPYVAFESALARLERTNRRLFILCIILILLLLATNLSWIYYENSFEDVVVTQDNANGYNSYIGNDGDINYGETNDKNKT